MNPSSAAMIRSLFINKEALEKGANRPQVPDQKVRKLGVLGAGMMGAGIAYVSANAGIEVVLIDQSQEAADRGRAHSEELLDKGIQRKKVTPAEEGRGAWADHRDHRLRRTSRLRPDRRGGLRGHEGQGGNRQTRWRRCWRRLHLRDQYLDSADHRARAGVKAAGAIYRHPLLLAGRQDDAGRDHQRAGRPATSPSPRRSTTCARSARRRSSSNDARFFYANRCIIPYINEGVRMVREGVDARADRECGEARRHAARPAPAGRRDLDRPRREDRQGDEGRDGRRLSRRGGRRGAVLARRRGPSRPQVQGRLLCLWRGRQAPRLLVRPRRPLSAARRSSPRSPRSNTAS